MNSDLPKASVSACILCPDNCGIKIRVEDGHLTEIRGDPEHPKTRGYICQKATRLDFYQNPTHRLRTPLRRRSDGRFEPISWDQAIEEIARKLVAIRDEYGGHTIAHYGGGGQGNHLGGAYANSLRAALDTDYYYSVLAQEKTGGFWVDGRLFGAQVCHPMPDPEGADVVLFIGTNPWQSHGFPRARAVIQKIAGDPSRTMIVIDPTRTETARKADIHLQVRPGGDAHLMLAMLGCLVQEDLVDHDFLDARTVGFEGLKARLADIPISSYAQTAGVDPVQVREVARLLASAKRGCVRTDLGLEHSLHSTLNLYLSKLLFLLTGHFAKKGTHAFHSVLMPLIRHSPDPGDGAVKTRVTGMSEIGKLFPPNILPLEIDTDHPERTRAVFVESANPLHTGADTAAYRKAFAKLDLLVVVDVVMTETAKTADYILPAPTQFEKLEATFFNFDFPENYFHLRHPVLDPPDDLIPEPELHRRLVVAMGEIPPRFPILELAARIHRRFPSLRIFPIALSAAVKLRPHWEKYWPLILLDTLGRALPKGQSAAAVLWGVCGPFVEEHEKAVRRAGITAGRAGLAEAMFQKLLDSVSRVAFSLHTEEEQWSHIRHKDGKIHLEIPELIEEVHELYDWNPNPAYPLVLLAGERRSYNANTIIRGEEWRKSGASGALKMHPKDAEERNLAHQDIVRCDSPWGSVQVTLEVTNSMRIGVVSLPHGYGLDSDHQEKNVKNGAAANDLTSLEHCDPIAKTPYHKFIPVTVYAIREVQSTQEAMIQADTGA